MAYRVNVKPSDISFEVNDNETVMAAAVRQGFTWPSVCGGVGECGVCFVEGLDPNKVAQPTSFEGSVIRRMAHRAKHGGIIRLACRLMPGSDIELRKVGPRPSKPQAG